MDARQPNQIATRNKGIDRTGQQAKCSNTSLAVRPMVCSLRRAFVVYMELDAAEHERRVPALLGLDAAISIAFCTLPARELTAVGRLCVCWSG
jgi:hypothetical protein